MLLLADHLGICHSTSRRCPSTWLFPWQGPYDHIYHHTVWSLSRLAHLWREQCHRPLSPSHQPCLRHRPCISPIAPRAGPSFLKDPSGPLLLHAVRGSTVRPGPARARTSPPLTTQQTYPSQPAFSCSSLVTLLPTRVGHHTNQMEVRGGGRESLGPVGVFTACVTTPFLKDLSRSPRIHATRGSTVHPGVARAQTSPSPTTQRTHPSQPTFSRGNLMTLLPTHVGHHTNQMEARGGGRKSLGPVGVITACVRTLFLKDPSGPPWLHAIRGSTRRSGMPVTPWASSPFLKGPSGPCSSTPKGGQQYNPG